MLGWWHVTDAHPIPHLDTFIRAAELSSFSAAAAQLGVTQAAVSQRIQAVEAAVGKSLFFRRGRRIELSDAGRTLCDYAQRIEALHQEARATLAGQKVRVFGRLDVAASSVPGEHLLPSLLKSFHGEHPHVCVRASVSDSMAVLKEVEAGRASIGLVGQQVRKPELEFKAFARDRLVVVAPPEHPLAAKRSVSLAQLRKQAVVLREVGSGIRHCFEKAAHRSGLRIEDFHSAMELGSNEAVRAAIRQGVGIAFLSELAVRDDLKACRLVALKVPALKCVRTMYVVLAKKRMLPLPARLFVEHLLRLSEFRPAS